MKGFAVKLWEQFPSSPEPGSGSSGCSSKFFWRDTVLLTPNTGYGVNNCIWHGHTWWGKTAGTAYWNQQLGQRKGRDPRDVNPAAFPTPVGCPCMSACTFRLHWNLAGLQSQHSSSIELLQNSLFMKSNRQVLASTAGSVASIPKPFLQSTALTVCFM